MVTKDWKIKILNKKIKLKKDWNSLIVIDFYYPDKWELE